MEIIAEQLRLKGWCDAAATIDAINAINDIEAIATMEAITKNHGKRKTLPRFVGKLKNNP